MYNVIYTRTRDNANDVIAESTSFKDEKPAIELFNNYVNSHVNEMLCNELLDCRMSIHDRKASIKIEGTHYCIAVVKDNS